MPSLARVSRSRVPTCLAFVLAMFATMLPSSPASGTMPGENGEILVNGHVDGERGLYVLDLEAASLTRLPIEVAYDLNLNAAAWSPTGRQIAFVRADQQQRNHTLWVYEMESGAITLLRSAPPGVEYTDVAWSPSGSEIAVGTARSVDGSWSAALTLVNPDGSITEEISLTSSFASRVEWSAGGSEVLLWLAWESPGVEDSEMICLLALGTDKLECIIDDGWWPSWSPDGEHIALGALPSSRLTIIDRAGAVTDEFAYAQGQFSTWSPDGRFIAYPAYLGEQEVGQYSIEILDLETLDREAYVVGIENVLDLKWRPVRPASGFLDVPDGHAFASEIAWLGAKGITAGCDPPLDVRFCPDRPVTRGELAAFLRRALGGRVPPVGLPIDFTDTAGSVFAADVEWLSATGITRGCDPPANTAFCPEESVTRGQLAAFLVRAMGYGGGGGDLFVDDNDSVFEEDIDRLAAAGVTRGCNPPRNTRFCPEESVTRAQMAAFLYRALASE